jgi:hypothetical protein
MTAPSLIFGPPLYAGASWMYRSLTSGRYGDLAVVVEVDLDLLAHRLDLGHRADVDAEHPDVVARVEADGIGEVGGQVGPAGILQGPPQRAGDNQREHDGHGEAAGQGLS